MRTALNASSRRSTITLLTDFVEKYCRIILKIYDKIDVTASKIIMITMMRVDSSSCKLSRFLDINNGTIAEVTTFRKRTKMT